METFGQRLQRLRKERKWSVNSAAKQAGIKQQALARLEQMDTVGNVQAWTLKRLAELYNVRMEYLCIGTEDESSERDTALAGALELDD